MNVLFVVWELDPFLKLGGLGDTARSFPGAMKNLGVDIRIVLPYYSVVKMGNNVKTLKGKFPITYAGKKEHVEIWETVHPDTHLPVYFIKNTTYLATIVKIETWAFFNKAVVAMLEQNILQWHPDILHLNDHHCGLIPLLVKQAQLPIKTVITIHNLYHQGHASFATIGNVGLDPTVCTPILWEIPSKQINFLLEGIIHSDIITTVSPSYAKEIMTEEFGCGLNEYLKGLEGRVFGILNGIDVNWRSTLHDLNVKYPFGLIENENQKKQRYLNWKEGKEKNKRYLQKQLGLKVSSDIPLFCFIGRLDSKQKGLEILHTMLRRINQEKIEFVILGTGEKPWEERIQWLATFYPKHISCNFMFDEALAHQIYAASDFIIIPSRFEPCGLIQMIAMLFGTIPIAYKTGGLKDSIQDGKTGFLFDRYNSVALERTVTKAIELRRDHKDKFEQMTKNAMLKDFSWKKSAQKYLSLYKQLLL